MALQLKYDADLTGTRYAYYPDGNNYANWATSVANKATWGVPDRGNWFIATGYYYLVDTVAWVQTTAGVYISVEFYNDEWKNVWNTTPDYERVKGYGQSQAQYLVDKIIKCNIQIVQNNLICARYANKFTAAQQQQIRDLQKRVIARENALKDQGLCSDIKTSYPTGYAELAPYMERLMSNNGVGVATWAVVVIAAVVIGALSTAAYFAYKYYASEAEKDVKYSKQLTRILTEKLTPEEYQQLLNETKGIVTKARIMQSIGGFSKYLLIGGAVVGGALLFRLIKNKG